MERGRDAGPGVTWVGVIVKLDNGDTVALEFDGNEDFTTADVIRTRSPGRDSYVITIRGQGYMWREGAQRYAEPVARRELEAASPAIEGEVTGG